MLEPAKMGTFSNRRGCSFDYLSVIRSRLMKICYLLILICNPLISVVIATLKAAL